MILPDDRPTYIGAKNCHRLPTTWPRLNWPRVNLISRLTVGCLTNTREWARQKCTLVSNAAGGSVPIQEVNTWCVLRTKKPSYLSSCISNHRDKMRSMGIYRKARQGEGVREEKEKEEGGGGEKFFLVFSTFVRRSMAAIVL